MTKRRKRPARESGSGGVMNQMRMMPFKRAHLRRLMKRAKLDLHGLSQRLGLKGVVFTPSQLQKIVEGVRVQPRGDVLAGLCIVFDVDVSEFYDLE